MSVDALTIEGAPSLGADQASRREGQFAGAPCDEITVGEVMHPGVIVAPPESPLRYVAQLMTRHRVHAVVVVGDDEEGGIWGFVSDNDLLSAIVRGDVDEHTAGGMAHTPVVTISRNDNLQRAAQVMSEHGLTHLLVLAAGQHPVGVVSTLDLASAVAARGRRREMEV